VTSTSTTQCLVPSSTDQWPEVDWVNGHTGAIQFKDNVTGRRPDPHVKVHQVEPWTPLYPPLRFRWPTPGQAVSPIYNARCWINSDQSLWVGQRKSTSKQLQGSVCLAEKTRIHRAGHRRPWSSRSLQHLDGQQNRGQHPRDAPDLRARSKHLRPQLVKKTFDTRTRCDLSFLQREDSRVMPWATAEVVQAGSLGYGRGTPGVSQALKFFFLEKATHPRSSFRFKDPWSRAEIPCRCRT